MRKPTKDQLDPALSLRYSLLALAGCADTLGLLIRKMMTLWERNSVPHPSNHTSEPMQKLTAGVRCPPLLDTGGPQIQPLGVLPGGALSQGPALPEKPARVREGESDLYAVLYKSRGRGRNLPACVLGCPGAVDLRGYRVVCANLVGGGCDNNGEIRLKLLGRSESHR